jgi:rhodanese-related sulfurtransferase
MRKIRGIAAINPTEAMQLINHEDALMLDIRDLNEYKEGHIPDAKNIPQSALASRLRELEKYKNKPVILYCRTGARSSSAASVLKKNGFQTVHSLGGGLSAWQTANLPIRKK